MPKKKKKVAKIVDAAGELREKLALQENENEHLRGQYDKISTNALEARKELDELKERHAGVQQRDQAASIIIGTIASGVSTVIDLVNASITRCCNRKAGLCHCETYGCGDLLRTIEPLHHVFDMAHERAIAILQEKAEDLTDALVISKPIATVKPSLSPYARQQQVAEAKERMEAEERKVPGVNVVGEVVPASGRHPGRGLLGSTVSII